MTKPRVLHVSHAADVTPSGQRSWERGLLALAALGEAHLHVSTLEPVEVLAIGAFHRRPASPPDLSVWPRHTGGRALPAGHGFVLVTLTLPHRSALVADRQTLAPEQVMNRCVRGVLHALRGLGVDVVYPGLDLLTHERRSVGVLGFLEVSGPTLFQAILATSRSLADGPFLLDRADPHGLIPTEFIAPSAATTLEEAAGESIRARLAPGPFAGLLAAGYAASFPIETSLLAPRAMAALVAGADAPAELVAPPQPSGASARVNGLLGPVEAWARVDADRVADLTLAGDFIAPADGPRRLAAALRGTAVAPGALQEAVAAFLDRDQAYFLGLRPADLVDLVQRSVGVVS